MHEFTIKFQDFEEKDQSLIINAILDQLKLDTTADKLQDIFRVGNIGIVFGKNLQGPYMRVSEKDRDLLTVLVREYA